MQLSKSPEELLHRLRSAIAADDVDGSVFNAACQRCGQGRWWDLLHKVRALRKESGIAFLTLDRNIYLTALSRCVKGEKGFGAVLSRQKAIVALAKRAWADAGASDDRYTNIGLNAALRVCVASGDAHAQRWAKELWAGVADKHKDTISYGSLALVFETCGQPGLVNALLIDATCEGHWKLSYVDLGALVNAAGERRDWRRAEALWDNIVVVQHVKPNVIAYVARAKVHLLCGRVGEAAEIIDDMLRQRLKLNPHAAELHIQALLVVYHSSLDILCYKRLSSALLEGERLVVAKGSSEQKKFIAQAKHVVGCIVSHPEQVRLPDVLLEWKAKSSVMVSWDPHVAGSRYIKSQR